MFGNLYDMLADYFESDYLRAAWAGQGVIGTFIGPKTPGSVYVAWHHMFGEVNGEHGMWGYVRGGMGRISRGTRCGYSHGYACRQNPRAQWQSRGSTPGERRRIACQRR